MMSETDIRAAGMAALASHAQGSPEPIELSEEDKSKDAFFVKLAEVVEAMVDRHGKDFAMGTLVLSARFIAEGKVLISRKTGVTAA